MVLTDHSSHSPKALSFLSLSFSLFTDAFQDASAPHHSDVRTLHSNLIREQSFVRAEAHPPTIPSVDFLGGSRASVEPLVDLDPVHLTNRERRLFRLSAHPGSAARIVAVELRFAFQSIKKSKLTLTQAQDVHCHLGGGRSNNGRETLRQDELHAHD